MTPPTDPPRPSPAAEAAEKYVEDEIASGRRCCTECGRKAEDRQAHVHKAWRAGASWWESQPCRCNNCIGPSWQLAQSAEKPKVDNSALAVAIADVREHLEHWKNLYDEGDIKAMGHLTVQTNGILGRLDAASQSASPPAPQEAPAWVTDAKALGALVDEARAPQSPSSSEASFAERAQAVVAQMDVWIQENRATGRFPGSGREGEKYLVGLIAAFAQQVRDETLEEAANLMQRREVSSRIEDLIGHAAAIRSLRSVSPSGRGGGK